MAHIGDTPAANRYASLVWGPDSEVFFETQAGVPVDGGRAHNRNLSPFTIAILPPNALLSSARAVEAAINLATAAPAAGGGLNAINSALSGNVDSIGAAASVGNAIGADRGVSGALAQVSLVNTEAAILRSVIADGQLLSDRGNEAFSTVVNAVTAADIGLQLQNILNAPPLTLLVNPTSMSINYTKLQSYGSRTRNGYLFEAWGLEQPKLSISGTTGGFVSGLADRSGVNEGIADGQVSSVSGYQWAARRDSAAWQHFMSLYAFYRNNGYIFDTVGRSEAHLFVGSIAITYDQWTYEGHFESFDFSFEEGAPHKIDFSVEFTVSRMFDSAEPPVAVLPQRAPTTSISDPRYTRGTASTGSNGTTDLLSRTGREQFVSDAGDDISGVNADIAQLPLVLMGFGGS